MCAHNQDNRTRPGLVLFSDPFFIFYLFLFIIFFACAHVPHCHLQMMTETSSTIFHYGFINFPYMQYGQHQAFIPQLVDMQLSNYKLYARVTPLQVYSQCSIQVGTFVGSVLPSVGCLQTIPVQQQEHQYPFPHTAM